MNHEDWVVVLRNAAGGVKPSWGGFTAQVIGFEPCGRMARVLTEDVRYPYVDEVGLEHLPGKRDDLGELLVEKGAPYRSMTPSGRWGSRAD